MRTKPATVVDIAEWRPEWQRKEDRRGTERLEHNQEILESPVPEEGELRDEALRVLRAIMLDPRAPDNARVAASAKVIEATKPKASAGAGAPPPGARLPPWMKPADGTKQ